MKMPQEKNGENTDLKCDLILCRNKEYMRKEMTGDSLQREIIEGRMDCK